MKLIEYIQERLKQYGVEFEVFGSTSPYRSEFEIIIKDKNKDFTFMYTIPYNYYIKEELHPSILKTIEDELIKINMITELTNKQKHFILWKHLAKTGSYLKGNTIYRLFSENVLNSCYACVEAKDVDGLVDCSRCPLPPEACKNSDSTYSKWAFSERTRSKKYYARKNVRAQMEGIKQCTIILSNTKI